MSPTAECDASPRGTSSAIPLRYLSSVFISMSAAKRVAQATEGRTPCVLAEVDGQLLSILSADAIAKRKGGCVDVRQPSIDVGRERTRC